MFTRGGKASVCVCGDWRRPRGRKSYLESCFHPWEFLSPPFFDVEFWDKVISPSHYCAFPELFMHQSDLGERKSLSSDESSLGESVLFLPWENPQEMVRGGEGRKLPFLPLFFHRYPETPTVCLLLCLVGSPYYQGESFRRGGVGWGVPHPNAGAGLSPKRHFPGSEMDIWWERGRRPGCPRSGACVRTGQVRSSFCAS